MFESEFPYQEFHCTDHRVYLQEEYLTAANSILQLTEEMVAAYRWALDIVRTDERLKETVHHYHRLLFSGDENAKTAAIQELFKYDESDGLHGMLIPVILLSGLPYTIKAYKERGIPASILVHTLSDLKLNFRKYRMEHGSWGTKNIRWLIMHFSGDIFRLGRLQFHVVPFPYNIRIFRNPVSGETMVFSGEGVPFRKDGKVDGTNGIFDREWVSQFSLTDEWIYGHRIYSDGAIQKDASRTAREGWELVCKPGDPVLKVHIPADGKLTPESCRDSYIQAVQFFNEYYPEVHFQVIFCYTWLLSPQLKHILPADSNIVKFQQEYSLFPIVSNETQTLQRVFGVDTFDAAQVPRDTTLQRLLFDYLSAGNHVHGGAGFILKDRIAREVYVQRA